MRADQRSEPMPRYLLNIYQPDGPPPPPEILEPVMRDLDRWNHDAKAAGVWVFTAGLLPSATVVRTRDGELLTTDGPYAEAKEHIGGFTIIEVPDLTAALEWAGTLSAASTLPVEVRPIG
jgi:hypothetical protein